MSAISKKIDAAHDKARRKGATSKRGAHKRDLIGKVDKETADALAWLFNMKL